MATRTISNNIFYIYCHINPLKNEIFYIGKGFGNRAYIKRGRSKYWKNITDKYGFIVDILENNLTEKEAYNKEIFYISKIGRKDLGNGSLVNLTNGGDGFEKGTRNSISTEFKKGHTPLNKGKAFMNTCKECSKLYQPSIEGGKYYCSKSCQCKNSDFIEKCKNSISTEEREKRKIRAVGRKLSEETKLKISLSKKGKTPWNKGLTKETDIRVKTYGESKSKNNRNK